MGTNEAHLEKVRQHMKCGNGISQEAIDDITAALEPDHEILRPKDKSELLPLFSETGLPTGSKAPRWVCHVLGLRHRCAHILLLWRSPALGDLLLLQIRDWSKDDSAGHLDITVGGHMTADDRGSQDAAFSEMLQELGLQSTDLEGGLESIGGYAHDESRPEENFHNLEWRDVYVGYLSSEAIARVRFPDREVAGLVLIPFEGAGSLLTQNTLPIASALRCSLPRCLEWLGLCDRRILPVP
jgi:hypothetical protein